MVVDDSLNLLIIVLERLEEDSTVCPELTQAIGEHCVLVLKVLVLLRHLDVSIKQGLLDDEEPLRDLLQEFSMKINLNGMVDTSVMKIV